MDPSNHPNPNVIRAGKMIRSGHSQDAIPLLDTFLVEQPFNTWALSERGRAKSFTGDHLGAVQDFTEIIRLQPDSPSGFTGRADVCKRAGNLSNAIDDYTKAIILDPNHGSAYFFRGRLKVQIGEISSALPDFTASIEHDKMGPLSGLLNRGLANRLLGNYTAAIKDLTAALEVECCPAVLAPYYRGHTRLSSGDFTGAIADFSLAIDAFPQLTNAYRHRAETKRRLGDISGAESDQLEYESLGGVDLPAYSLQQDG